VKPAIVGTAIANAEGRGHLEDSREELRRLADEQAALRRVATLVAPGLPPAEVFAAVAHEVGHVLGADGANIVRLDPDGAVTVVTRVGDRQAELPVGAAGSLSRPWRWRRPTHRPSGSLRRLQPSLRRVC
jgi:hypothetical protein